MASNESDATGGQHDGAAAEQALATMQEQLAATTNLAASISELHTTAKSASDFVATAQQSIATLLANLQAKVENVSGLAAKVQATETSMEAASSSMTAHIEVVKTGRVHVGAVRNELDKVLAAAKQSAIAAESSQARAQTNADAVTQAGAEVAANRTIVATETAAIAEASNGAKAANKKLSELAALAMQVDDKLHEYEERLVALQGRADAQLEHIDKLLPGATSAGLAHAFDVRGKTFKKPGRWWQGVFVGSLLAIIALAMTSLWHVYSVGSTLSYDELFRLWLVRLPIAGALVWLALHASRESALSKRLEEDYAYKAATASSFSGFQKQMIEIGSGAAAGTPLATLCENTLSAISSPPGRIYDKHRLTVSLADEIKRLAEIPSETIKAAAATLQKKASG